MVKRRNQAIVCEKGQIACILYTAHLKVLNILHPAIIGNVVELIETEIREAIKIVISKHIKKSDNV